MNAQEDDLVDLTINVPKDLHDKITALGAQCGITGDQMAGALLVIFNHGMLAHPMDESTVVINGELLRAPVSAKAHIWHPENGKPEGSIFEVHLAYDNEDDVQRALRAIRGERGK